MRSKLHAGVPVLLAVVLILVSSPAHALENWVRVSEPGFGDPDNVTAEAAAVWGRTLYVGTINRDSGAKIFAARVSHDRIWIDVSPTAETWRDNTNVTAMTVFDGHLYVATQRAEIWRYDGFGNWRKVSPSWDYDARVGVTDLAVYRGELYAALGGPARVMRLEKRGGTNIWHDAMGTGDFVVPPGFGRNDDASLYARFGVWRGHFYLGIGRANPGGSGSLGDAVQVWAYQSGAWIHLTSGLTGFGDPGNGAILAIQGYGDHVYVGTHNGSGGGAQLWRTGLGPADWENVTPSAWDTRSVAHAHAITFYGDTLYVGTRDANQSGIWMSDTPGIPDSWETSAAAGENLTTDTDLISTLTSIYPFVYATVRTLDGVEVYRRLPSP